MPLFHLHVYGSATAGREQEFGEWYENVHLDEVLTAQGFASGQRFDLVHQGGYHNPNHHLGVYEVEAESAQDVLAALGEGRASRTMVDGLFDATNVSFQVFQAAGPRHDA